MVDVGRRLKIICHHKLCKGAINVLEKRGLSMNVVREFDNGMLVPPYSMIVRR